LGNKLPPNFSRLAKKKKIKIFCFSAQKSIGIDLDLAEFG
jgi:hypothetical protein